MEEEITAVAEAIFLKLQEAHGGPETLAYMAQSFVAGRNVKTLFGFICADLKVQAEQSSEVSRDILLVAHPETGKKGASEAALDKLATHYLELIDQPAKVAAPRDSSPTFRR